jgi:hypothetical protein
MGQFGWYNYNNIDPNPTKKNAYTTTQKDWKGNGLTARRYSRIICSCAGLYYYSSSLSAVEYRAKGDGFSRRFRS